MELEIAKKLSPESVAILIAVTIYIVKTAWEFIAKTILKSKDEVEENTQAVKELILEMGVLKTEMVRVRLSVEKLDEFKHLAWKLEKDVAFAHEKIRDLKDESRT